MISSITSKGIEAQLKAELRANELGYIVSKPTTDCCRYDMILDDGKKLKRIQVKYCDRKQSGANGSIALSLRKFSLNKKERPYYTKDEIDAIIVYVKPIEKLCYLDIDIIEKKSSITLRYELPKNNQGKNIYLVDDYLW